jgi:hypothetical protein
MCFVVPMMGAASRIAHMTLSVAMPRTRFTMAEPRAILLGRGIAKECRDAENQDQEDRYKTETFGH